MAGLRLKAIVPKRPVIRNINTIRPRLERRLRDWAVDMQSAMAKYPAQEPTPYVRTGSLGKHWIIKVLPGKGIEVSNAVTGGGKRRRRAYAVYVQGPKTGPAAGTRQTKVMRSKGWQNITDESKRIWSKHVPLIVKVFVQ